MQAADHHPASDGPDAGAQQQGGGLPSSLPAGLPSAQAVGVPSAAVPALRSPASGRFAGRRTAARTPDRWLALAWDGAGSAAGEAAELQFQTFSRRVSRKARKSASILLSFSVLSLFVLRRKPQMVSASPLPMKELVHVALGPYRAACGSWCSRLWRSRRCDVVWCPALGVGRNQSHRTAPQPTSPGWLPVSRRPRRPICSRTRTSTTSSPASRASTATSIRDDVQEYLDANPR